MVNTKRTFPVTDQRLHAGVKFPQLNVQILKMLLLLLKPLTQTQTHRAIKTVFIYPVFPSDFHSLLLSLPTLFPFSCHFHLRFHFQFFAHPAVSFLPYLIFLLCFTFILSFPQICPTSRFLSRFLLLFFLNLLSFCPSCPSLSY